MGVMNVKHVSPIILVIDTIINCHIPRDVLGYLVSGWGGMQIISPVLPIMDIGSFMVW